MKELVKDIVIVGGGTAGWLTANILASQLRPVLADALSITLIESPDIPTIGVGEGTVPTMRQTLKMIGISETDFIQQCDVAFKQSIKFVNWLHEPKSGQEHSYHHLFQYPISPGFDVTPYWLAQRQDTETLNFADTVSMQGQVCEQGLAPKKITHKEYQGALDYAYHLDAGKLAKLLMTHGIAHWDIKLVQDTVTKVNILENGDIGSLDLASGKSLSGQLFIDCSGFQSILLGKALGVNFDNKSDYLFVDRALAVQVPYETEEQDIKSYTVATAHQHGWIWDIGLTTRRGVGLVYSSKYCDESEAAKTLAQYLELDEQEINYRAIDMNIGYREKFWHKNCVAIGLSAGFLEPLEATAILLIEATAKLIAEQYPFNKSLMSSSANKVNEITKYGWDRVIDFIKLHYCLNQRNDSEFWINNRDRASIPPSLLQKLDVWQHRAPVASDFASKYEVFHLDNYQYVLYGMNFPTNSVAPATRYEQYKDYVRQLMLKTESVVNSLPKNRQLIELIQQHGLHKI